MTHNHSDSIRIARETIEIESEALSNLAKTIDDSFAQAVDIIFKTSGKTIVTGIGKSGRVAQKVASTLCSTGTPAVFLHAGEAVHGDLGIYQPGDPTILISKSGSTNELVKLVPVLKEFKSPLIAIVGNINSPLATMSDVVIDVTVSCEADPLGIVPTTSALATLAIGDALTAALMHARNFEKNDFARFHPAGQLGRNLLLTVKDVMHPIKKVAHVLASMSLKDTVSMMTKYPLGAACVMEDKRLIGLVTDGDLRRAIQEHHEIGSLTAADVMTKSPIGIRPQSSLGDAVELMENRPSQISVLPVIDTTNDECVGLLRIHDIYQPHLL